MRTLIYTSCLLFIALFGVRSSHAQVNAETRMGNGKSYWTLGLNAGFAWQDSDIRSQLGGGWGFYFGSSIYNKPNSFFSADWRFRYMNTYTFGQNARDTRLANPTLANPSLFSYDPSTESFAHNHFTAFHDLALEFRLNFEALRRRTNIMLSIYGGAGLGIYGTYFDQKDFSGSDYNYDDQLINYAGSDESIADDILSLRDEEYETAANADPDGDREARLGIMPSVGIELGYWFSPHFALAIGHRTTFTLQENFDGVRINNGSTIPGSIHHYTALMLHWRVFNARAQISCPDVEFDLPVQGGVTYNTQEPNVFVRAYVRNVSTDQIIYTVNGASNRFMVYNSGDQSLQGNLQLVPGDNLITIRAKNSCGTDAQSVVVVYTPRDNTSGNPRVVTPTAQPPIVTITSPGQPNTTSSVNTISVRANVQYVADRGGITFTVNGTPTGNFNYNNGAFSADNVGLIPGQNRITVTGTNIDGTDSKTIIVNYQAPQDPLPVVTLTQPGSNPFNTQSPTATVGATILNVTGISNVQCTVNGRTFTGFTFNGTNFTINNLALQRGANRITITGRNNAGQDSKTQVINYEPVQQVLPPVVNIIDPRVNPFNTQNSRASISATILNVASRADVQCTVNGRNFTNFSFSGTNFFISSLNLQRGANNITITGRNSAGQDFKTQIINYEPIQQVLPPVVTITNPRVNPFNTQNPSANVSATILNVTGLSNVQCTVNGRTFTGFTFQGTSFNISNMALQRGANRITITGRNSAGQDSKTQIINYEPVQRTPPPVVTITEPLSNPFNTSNQRASVAATILNVASSADVQCTVNGRTFTGFTFRGTSFVIGSLSLQRGANRITITGRNSAGQDSKTQVINYEPIQQAPPPVVTITSPAQNPFNTNNNQVNLAATILNVSSSSDVQFSVNGRSSRSFTFSGTRFSATNIALNPGSNTLVVTGRNPQGQDSKSTVVIYNQPQELEPSVQITNPSVDPYTSTSAVATINATILNVSGRNNVTFTVNGRTNTNFSFSGTSFVATGVNLTAGNNVVRITGTNNTGTAQDITTLIYQPAPPPPTVTITNPNRNPTTVQTSSINIAATITNVADRNGVTFTINGRTSTGFNFSGTSFTANNINLTQGRNTFTITGRNSAGQASQSTVVVYEVPVLEPTVQITTPAQDPYRSTQSTTTINATIRNVSSRNNVTFTVNGRTSTNFSFSGTSFVANNVSLNNGNNNIVITGSNSSGTAQDTRVITYTAPKPPGVNITSPSANPFNTSSNRVTINATIDNVLSSRDVTFTVNGRQMTNFTFSGRNFTASNVPLNNGQNVFQVTGRNTAGQASDNTTVIYTPMLPRPTVTITAPSGNPATSSLSVANVTATVTNVPDRSGISVTVNGRSVTNFLYNGTTVNVTNLVLALGNNTVIITGTNRSGSASDSKVIVYNNVRDPRGTGGNNQSQTGPGSTGGSGGVDNKGGSTIDGAGSGTNTNGGNTRGGTTRTPNGGNTNQQGGGTSGGSGGLNRPGGSKKNKVNTNSSSTKNRTSEDGSSKKGKVSGDSKSTEGTSTPSSSSSKKKSTRTPSSGGR